MRDEPRPLQVYKHFKGTYYQVLVVAKHSETGERLVIYRALFGDGDVYARPLEMFLSEVDHDKYPEVKQKYRFALATGESRHGSVKQADGEQSVAEEDNEEKDDSEETGEEKKDDSEVTGEEKDDDSEVTDEEDSSSEDEKGEREIKKGQDDFLDKFLDAGSFEEKLDIFTDMWKTIDENNIDSVAVVMDVELTGETLEEKYKEILNCLKMRAKYECSRLR